LPILRFFLYILIKYKGKIPITSKIYNFSINYINIKIYLKDIFHQSTECQRQLLPENRPYCQALGGYANPRCPSQHWLAKFSLIEFFVLLNLFCWPLLLAILISALFKLDKKEIEDIWINQRYSLIISFR